MRIPGWLLLVGTVALVALTGGCALLAFAGARTLALDAQQVGVVLFSPPRATPTPLPAVVAQAAPSATPPGASPAPTSGVPTATLDPLASYQWDDPRRVTILLLGIDQRSELAERSENTDSIILVSIDPIRKTAAVLNIPRDLWVPIPGFGNARINTAFAIGEANAYPGGGPALAVETVEQTLGIDVDYYLLVNFEVFYAVVNALAPNGVQICVEQTIDDPTYPDNALGTIPVRFDPGCQRLDATRLLQYARTRATQGGDFDRARRQQQVLQALREEVLSAGGVAAFVTQAPALWGQLTGSIRTDLTLDDILRLATLAQDIPRENIRFGVIDTLYATPGTATAADGTQQQILTLRQGAVRTLLDDLFTPQQTLTLADLRQRADAEGARIVVYNNTSIPGLAGNLRDWLLGENIAVFEIGNMPAPTNANTVIRDYTGKLWTARYLAALLGLPPERIESGSDGLTSADVMIVVGPDVQTLIGGAP